MTREVLRPIKLLVSELTEEHVGCEYYIFDKYGLMTSVFRIHFLAPGDFVSDVVRVGFVNESGRQSSMHLPLDKEVFVYLPIKGLPEFIALSVTGGWL